MTPLTLFTDLQAAGFTLRTEAGKLKVSPFSKLNTKQKADLATHRVGLLELLAELEQVNELLAQTEDPARPFRPRWFLPRRLPAGAAGSGPSEDAGES